jgi:hypothetical protein
METTAMRCSKCGEKPLSRLERDAGECATCHVASWSEEKRLALDRLIGLPFHESEPSEVEIEAAIEEAFKHLNG